MRTDCAEPPIQEVLNSTRHLDSVWFTDRIQGKFQGMAAAVSVADELVTTE